MASPKLDINLEYILALLLVLLLSYTDCNLKLGYSLQWMPTLCKLVFILC